MTADEAINRALAAIVTEAVHLESTTPSVVKADQRLFAGGQGGRGWVVIFGVDYPEHPDHTFVSVEVVEPSGQTYIFPAL